MNFHTMKIAGLTRNLPLCKINENLSIAAFIMFGDAEITVRTAEELLKKVPDFDYIIAPEAKAIPLAHEMSRQSGKKYFVARKSEKLYMKDPLSITVKSLTTEDVQKLYLCNMDVEKIKNSKLLIVDDVISSGESLSAVKALIEKAGGEVAASCAVLAEGAAADRTDIIFLEKLPLF